MRNETHDYPWKELLEHKPHHITFGDIDILVENTVFTPNPRLTYSTSIILENLPELYNTRVADIGTGTGILAIQAAKKGANAVATDISSTAIQNALINIQKNKLIEKITTVKADLLDGVDGPFDFIFANIPILEEVWETVGVNTDSILKKLFKTAKEKLKPKGQMYVPWGSFAEEKRQWLERSIYQEGYRFHLKRKKKLGYTWYLYILSK